jgi:23S rRNA (cytosine1962-C5)-methyltransferase
MPAPAEHLPLILFEDEHLLVVNKPAGWNTHAPSPWAGEGIYDWLRHREPRWAALAILHRLDKETSGVLAFGKTPLANRSLTGQFTDRSIHKTYLAITDRPVAQAQFTVVSKLARAGERYLSRPLAGAGERAETRFRVRRREAGRTVLEAEPVTGRTHQIRAQAAARGFPLLGDVLYGGTRAARLALHAARLTLRHPGTGESMTFEAPGDLLGDPRASLRGAWLDPSLTNACRLIHGAADGWPGWYVDRLGDYLLSQSEQPLAPAQQQALEQLLRSAPSHHQPSTINHQPLLRGAYHKVLTRQAGRSSVAEASPRLVWGDAAPEPFYIRENGLQYALRFNQGGSVGLFLDQRDNRRRLLAGHVAAGFSLTTASGPVPAAAPCPPEALNTFAYTCGFSVGAARHGWRVTSLDLSKKYLTWGRQNFSLNGLDPARHDFIYGDVFVWLRRFRKQGRAFELIILDPPTFSRSKTRGPFQAQKDYGGLVAQAVPLLQDGGVLLAGSNAGVWRPEEFVAAVEGAAAGQGRRIVQRHYAPQPPDFPITRDEPAYLKTLWVRLSQG